MAKFVINGWEDEEKRQKILDFIEKTESFVLEIKKPSKRITSTQHKALHHGYSRIEELCVKNGITKDMLFANIGKETEFQVSDEDIKEVFRAIAFALYKERTTTAIPPDKVKKVWDIAAMAFARRMGLDIGEFPCQESLMAEQIGY